MRRIMRTKRQVRKGKVVPKKRTIYKRRPVFKAGPRYGIKAEPFPMRLNTKMVYTTSGTLTASSTQDIMGAEVVYRLNSIYDPQYALGGETVAGHAAMSTLYESYIVNGVKVQIRFNDPSVDGMVCAYSWNQDDASAIIQGKATFVAGRHPHTGTVALSDSGNQKATRSLYIRPWQLEGLSKLEWKANKSTRSSLMNNNPTNEQFLRLACSRSSASGAGTIRYDLRITYYTEFFGRKILGPSV